jgi:hypothetical protein
MAEIPVEKKSGTPWWIWLLLGALALAALIWILADNDPEPVETAAVPPADLAVPVAPAAPVTPVAPAAPATPAADPAGPITDLATLTGAADLAPMVGRQVDLAGVPVAAMAGDRTFFVGEGSNRLFVLLPEGRPGVPTEDSVNVNAGQTVALSGTLQAAAPTVAGTPVEGLPAGAQAMLVADSVRVVSR